jgi:hypothetical protein
MDTIEGGHYLPEQIFTDQEPLYIVTIHSDRQYAFSCL